MTSALKWKQTNIDPGNVAPWCRIRKHGLEFPSVGSDVLLHVINTVRAGSAWPPNWKTIVSLSHQGVGEQIFQHPVPQPRSPGEWKDTHAAIYKGPPSMIGTCPMQVEQKSTPQLIYLIMILMLPPDTTNHPIHIWLIYFIQEMIRKCKWRNMHVYTTLHPHCPNPGLCF